MKIQKLALVAAVLLAGVGHALSVDNAVQL